MIPKLEYTIKDAHYPHSWRIYRLEDVSLRKKFAFFNAFLVLKHMVLHGDAIGDEKKSPSMVLETKVCASRKSIETVKNKKRCLSCNKTCWEELPCQVRRGLGVVAAVYKGSLIHFRYPYSEFAHLLLLASRSKQRDTLKSLASSKALPNSWRRSPSSPAKSRR